MEKIVNDMINEYENDFENRIIKRLSNEEDYIVIKFRINDIMKKYPKLQNFIENGKIEILTNDEKKSILELLKLQEEMKKIEVKESFKLGFKEAIIYFQEMKFLNIHREKNIFNYEEWNEKYNKQEVIDLREIFTKKDLEIIKKLGVKIKNKLYTQYEFELLSMNLLKYYKDKDMSKEELKFSKSLRKTGVNRKEYNILMEKIDKEIEKIYSSD